MPTDTQPSSFAFLTDLHFGWERRHGHKVALHDQQAMNVAIAFVQDFKPNHLILGGDILDCGVISHHNHGKPGRTEELRLKTDAADCSQQFIQPLEAAAPKADFTFIEGNHEDWLRQFVEEHPGVTGMLEVEYLLKLGKWRVIPQGGYHTLGKLTFIHGDTLSSGEHCAKNAVINYERNVRFGHFHTYQTFTKNTPINTKLGKTGVAVPCLCRKDPSYGKGKPNRWVQGFNYGWVWPDGTYHDTVATIVNGRTVANGKVYKA